MLFDFLHVVCVVHRTADARFFQGRRRVRAYCMAECTGRPETFGRFLRQTTLHVQWIERLNQYARKTCAGLIDLLQGNFSLHM
jgi:hypothetical protein